jgi:ferric-dicitrate binding protein FerR (iron transport regulator)
MLIETLLEKWKNQGLSPEEKRQLLEQLESEEGERAFAQLWDHAWDQAAPGISGEGRVEAELERIRQQIKQQIVFAPSQEAAPVRPLWRPALAAAAVSLLILGTWLLRERSEPAQQAASLAAEAPLLAETVQRGERSRRLLLGDGSEVWLNVDSRLRFPAAFSDTLREVWLEGEASFEVRHDPSRPFIVHAGGLRTEVLGTLFYVSAYAGEPMSVALAKGRVKVSAAQGQEVILLPNQQVFADSQTRNWDVRRIDAGRYGIWREGLFVYDDLPLGELEERLERWYNVRISFRDEATRRCRISGTPTHRPIWDLLESFRFIAGVEYRISESGEIELSGGNCP